MMQFSERTKLIPGSSIKTTLKVVFITRGNEISWISFVDNYVQTMSYQQAAIGVTFFFATKAPGHKKATRRSSGVLAHAAPLA
jgi:hypothetical protein